MAKRKTPRTGSKRKAGHLRAGGISLDLDNRSVTKGKVTLRLTPKQCALLKAFMNNGGVVLTRKFLMKEVWDTDWMEDTRTLDVHVRWLRQKIEDNPSKPVYLRTVRGVGYRFEAPA
ncbi:MAG: response regulator transcription factor [Anaerolineae bacterium]|nr:response regulator transcription factor [Anaerolineae bacterium]